MDKKIELVKYRETLKDWKVIAISILITGLIAWLFYRSIWGALMYPIVLGICIYYFHQAKEAKRKEIVLEEFREILKLICSELRSGHSLETAVMSLYREIEGLFGAKALTLTGINIMQQQLKMKQPVEQAITNFATFYGYEEIVNFAYTITYAKRLGGNYIKNISNTADKLGQRLEVKQEIRATLAEKQLEMKIMGVMPMGILVYIGLTSYEFIEPLYHNLIGVIVMTVCLIAYVVCLYIAKRIVTIRW